MIGYVPKKKIPSPPVLKFYYQQNIVYHQAIISRMPAFRHMLQAIIIIADT